MSLLLDNPEVVTAEPQDKFFSRALLKRRKLSVEEICRIADVSDSTVSHLRRGTKRVGPKSIKAIADVLHRAVAFTDAEIAQIGEYLGFAYEPPLATSPSEASAAERVFEIVDEIGLDQTVQILEGIAAAMKRSHKMASLGVQRMNVMPVQHIQKAPNMIETRVAVENVLTPEELQARRKTKHPPSHKRKPA